MKFSDKTRGKKFASQILEFSQKKLRKDELKLELVKSSEKQGKKNCCSRMDTLIGSNRQRLHHTTHNKAPHGPAGCKSQFSQVFMNAITTTKPYRSLIHNYLMKINWYAISKNCSPLFCPVVVVGVVFG